MDGEHRHRLAVVDCGTNTFTLHVARLELGVWKPVFRQRRFVRLGHDSFRTGRLSPLRMRRGLDVLASFRETALNFGVTHGRAIGCSALRDAANGAEFVAGAGERGWAIAIIDGDREAACNVDEVERAIDERRGRRRARRAVGRRSRASRLRSRWRHRACGWRRARLAERGELEAKGWRRVAYRYVRHVLRLRERDEGFKYSTFTFSHNSSSLTTPPPPPLASQNRRSVPRCSRGESFATRASRRALGREDHKRSAVPSSSTFLHR